MTLAPRFLVNLWAGYRATRLARRMCAPGRDAAGQQAAFAALISAQAATEFGRTHGLKADTTVVQFQDQVPPRTYDYFKPLVARMAAGEPDVLAAGKCPFFVESAGTTDRDARLLPVPEAMLAQYSHGLRDALLLHAARAGHAGVFLGRHLHAGASTALIEQPGSYRTNLDGMLALCLSPWVEANLYAPPAAVARLPEGSEKIAATLNAMLRRDVTLVGGTPSAVCALAAAARESTGQAQLQNVWPNLECYLHTGAPLGLFADTLRAALGPAVTIHEVYAAAEGVFAAQDTSGPGLRLLTDAGVFYEFIPLAEYNEANLAAAHSVTLGNVQAGVDYVLLVTTPAGLCRCAVGDIVRFVSVTPPRLEIVGRTALRLNAFGERLGEQDLLEVLQSVCERNEWKPVSFHVAPFQQRLGPGRNIQLHEWWLELLPHTTRTPTANVLGPEFDAELSQRHRAYAEMRNRGTLGSPQVRLVMPGVFAQWAAEQRKISSASKMPRCRSDRLIADQLAALTRFHQHSLAPFAKTGRG